MAAAVVPDRRPDPLRQCIQIGDQGFDGLALMIRMILECGVEIVDVGRMMLAMVNLHGLGVDMRFQCTMVVWQRRQGVLSHGFAPRVTGNECQIG